MADVRDDAEEGGTAKGCWRSPGKTRPSADPGKEVVLRPPAAKDKETCYPTEDLRPGSGLIKAKIEPSSSPWKRRSGHRESHEYVKDQGGGSR
eukprot:12277005-Heterocapsa_arctica.AAC.1